MYFCAQCSITYEKSNKKGLCQVPECKATLKWKCPDCSNTVRWNWRSRHKCDPNGANYARNNQSKAAKNNLKSTSSKTQNPAPSPANAARPDIPGVHAGNNALPSLVSILPGQSIVDSPERGFQPHWAVAGVPTNILRASVHSSANVVPEGGLPAMRYFKAKSEDMVPNQRNDLNVHPMQYSTGGPLQGLHIPKMVPTSMMMMAPMHGIEYMSALMPREQHIHEQQPTLKRPASPPEKKTGALQSKAAASPEASKKRKADHQTTNPSKKADNGSAGKSHSAKKSSPVASKNSQPDILENEAKSSGVSALIDAAAAADLEYNKSNQANKAKNEKVKIEKRDQQEQKSPNKKATKSGDEKSSAVNSNGAHPKHVSILPIKKRGALACV